jgi:hypothetical protein
VVLAHGAYKAIRLGETGANQVSYDPIESFSFLFLVIFLFSDGKTPDE